MYIQNILITLQEKIELGLIYPEEIDLSDLDNILELISD